MKKLLIPLLLVIMLVFTGCTSSIQIGALEQSSSHKFSASYIKLSGTKETNITVKDGEPIDISVDIVTKKGILDAYIYKEKGNYDYEGHDIKTSSFKVTLSEPGDYTIKLVAKNHKGSYKFKW